MAETRMASSSTWDVSFHLDFFAGNLLIVARRISYFQTKTNNKPYLKGILNYLLLSEEATMHQR